MKKQSEQVTEAILRLKGSPDFALLMTWLDASAADAKNLAVQPLTPTDVGREHLAGKAYGLEQLTKKIRQIWDADKEQKK